MATTAYLRVSTGTQDRESIHFEGKQDLQTKVMVALFGLFAEVERGLISECRAVLPDPLAEQVARVVRR